MKKITKKLLSALLAICLFTTMFANPSFALSDGEENIYADSTYPSIVYKNELSLEEIDYKIKEDIYNHVLDTIESSGNATRMSEWRIEYGTPVSHTFEGFAGNQPAVNGYRFPTGGGFYYSESGGPNVSVSLSLGGKYGSVSVSTNLGNKSTTGLFITAPDTVNYYKLWVAKTVRYTPYTLYTRETSVSEWQETYGYDTEVLDVIAYAKRV